MKNFWSGLLNAVLSGALQGGAAASQQGSNIRVTGITAGVGAVAGVLQFFLQHPATSAPAALATPAVTIRKAEPTE